MIVSKYNLSTMGLGAFAEFGFSDLPDLAAQLGSDAARMLEYKDVLNRFDFQAHYDEARQISAAIQAVAGEPEASALVAAERAAKNTLLAALDSVVSNFPFNVFGRGAAAQRALDSAATVANDQATLVYKQRLQPQLFQVQQAIADRQARAVAATSADQARQVAEQTAKTAEAAKIAAQQSTAAAQAQSFQAQAEALAVEARAKADKLIAQANEIQILGLPLSVFAPIALAVAGGGTYLFLRARKKKSKSLAGYARRRR